MTYKAMQFFEYGITAFDVMFVVSRYMQRCKNCLPQTAQKEECV